MAATSEDCPCCSSAVPLEESDLIVAFLGGFCARAAGVRISDALCEKHGRLAADCATFVHDAMHHGVVRPRR